MMKVTLPAKLIPAFGFAWLLTLASVGSLAASADRVTETIYVEYRENHNDQYVRGYNSMNNELDRYHYFKSNFENTFTARGYPVNFEFSRFPVKAPEGAKVLRLTYLGLESFNPLEVQLRMWASLEERGEKTDFGIKLVRYTPRALPSSISVERDLDAIYTKAAQKVVSDLDSTILPPFKS